MWYRMTFAIGQNDEDREERVWEVSPMQTVLRRPGCLIPADNEDNRKGTYRADVAWDKQSRDSQLLYPAMAFYCITLRIVTCSVWTLRLSAKINW